MFPTVNRPAPGLTQTEIDQIIACANQMADAARIETLTHFRRPGLDADNKLAAGFDPVTVADRASEAAMRRVLAELRPMDGILGEEEAAKLGTSGLTWVIDPIDGTRGYLTGTPVWGVLIGLRDAEGPLFGIVDQPFIGERWLGGFGHAEYQGPRGSFDLSTSTRQSLSEARLFTTFPEVGTAAEGAAFRRVAAKAKLTRYGLDCYGYMLLAMGSADLVIEAGLQPYDVMAPIAVIEAAGGVVTDWKGGPAFHGGQVLAAANPALHREALDLLGEAGS